MTDVEISLGKTPIFDLSYTRPYLAGAAPKIKSLILDGFYLSQSEFINLMNYMISAKSLIFRNWTLTGFGAPFNLGNYTPSSVLLSEIVFISTKSSNSTLGKSITISLYSLNFNLIQ